MSALELRQSFRRRFRATARQIWSLHVVRGVAWTVLAAAVVVAAVAAADYVFELAWWVRAVLMTAGLAVVAVLAARWVVRPALAWSRPRVAAELEGLFPRLGQRLRTATEHGERPAEELARDGVAPGLVAALENETAEKVKPLPFQAALPVRPAFIAGAMAALGIAAIVAAASWMPEWRTAVVRAGLAPTPYTDLTATPSANVVDEGANVDILATVSGRARPEVVLHVRENGDGQWRQETMDASDGAYASRLTNLQTNTEFFVVAGPERTPVQQIVVRHALKIVGTRAEVTSPAYTGVPIAKYDSGSFAAVQGSTAKVRFELDRAPVSAALVVKETGKRNTVPRRIDVTVQDRFVSFDMPLTTDVEYTIEAGDSDGMPLAANRNRLRVVADQPPTVWFETPPEGLEVHTLAEVLLRVRARDDYGLTKVGIVFQVNNEEERTLVLEDITQPNQREAKAEQLLMLEQFLLTQKDCVAYYAFAEDNRPDGPQRTTTELRFIDIRPFLRIYKLQEASEPTMPGEKQDFIFLDEVIARQRFNLNQTMRLEIRSKVRIDLPEVEKTAAFENKLATQTHNLIDFLLLKGIDGAAILAQAEEAMLSAVDSLNAAKFTTAINQERDALRYLMEARETVQQSLTKQSKGTRAAARAFDRMLRQKLRRPKDETETLMQLADELNKLANEEDDVGKAIAGNLEEPKKPMAGEGDDDPAEPKKNGKGKDPAQDKQDDVAGRAGVLDTQAANAKGLTPLAKTRIGDAAKAANEAADALGKGDRPTARKQVDRAKELFRTAAKQVDALAKEEAAQMLAAARDLANELAQQTAPSDPMKDMGPGKGGDKSKPDPGNADKGKETPMGKEPMPGAGNTAERGKEPMPGAGNTAEKGKEPMPGGGGGANKNDKNKEMKPGLGNAAEQAKSLKDVLEKLAASTAEGDADPSRKAGALLKQEDLANDIARLEKPGVENDRGERQDLSDRFAALGQKLDQAYRDAIAPRLEEIARLEREANELMQKAAAADDPTEVRRVRQQGAGFIAKLEAAGLENLVSEDLRVGANAGGNAGLETFNRGVATVHTRLVSKLQELISADKYASGNEAVPPEYKDLVERYLRALSAGRSK